MIGQYLSNTNESVTIHILQKKIRSKQGQGIKSCGETGWKEKRVKRPNLLILQFLNFCSPQKLKNKIPTTCAWQQQRLRIHNIGFFTLYSGVYCSLLLPWENE
jgi:hypothetical protein